MTATSPADWLTDADEASVCFVDETDVDALIQAGADFGQAIVDVDLAGCENRSQAFERLAARFTFPDWFGNNWDALSDCLGDLSWLPSDGYLTVIRNFNDWQLAQPDDVDTLLDIFDTASLRWAALGVPFWLLLPVPAERLAGLPDDDADNRDD